MIELERTFLAKYHPEHMENFRSHEVYDIYFPLEAIHPTLRLRKIGDKYEMTKKSRISQNDLTKLKEETIDLSEEEFKSLSKVKGREVRKRRYYYDKDGVVAEIGVFLDELKGLTLIDFEFASEKEMREYKAPDYCLVDVSQEEFFACGTLCGKSYEQIADQLQKFGYKKL